MPFCDVFPWCSHDVVPMAILFSGSLGTQRHLAKLPPLCLLALVQHSDCDIHVVCLLRVNANCQRFIEDGGAALCFSFRLYLPPHLLSYHHTDLGLAVCVCMCVCVCVYVGGGNAYHLYPGKPCMCLAEYHELQSLSKLIAIYGNQLAQNKKQILFFLCHLPVNTGDAECSKNVLFWRWGQFNLTALCWTPYHAVFSTEFIDQRSQMTSHDHTPLLKIIIVSTKHLFQACLPL